MTPAGTSTPPGETTTADLVTDGRGSEVVVDQLEEAIVIPGAFEPSFSVL